MIFSWEITPTILIALVIQIVVVVISYVRTSDRAKIAIKAAETASAQVSLLSAAFNLYQVNIARDYVSREVLKEFEERLTRSAKENVDRLAREISELREVIIVGRNK